MFSGMLRLGSDVQNTGVVGVNDGELDSDRPRESGCRDEPGGINGKPVNL